MTKIIAHRGYAKSHPENTLASFRAALDYGADAIELDVHMTRDGQFVVHHDYYLSDGELIFKRDYADIVTLKVNGEKIPLLGEVFELIGNKLHYELELKGFAPEFLSAVIQLVGQYGLSKHIEFTSPIPYNLSRLHELAPSFKTGCFVSPFPAWMDMRLGQELAIHNALLGHTTVLHCPLEIIDKGFIATAHKQSLRIHAANCNTKEDLQKAFALGVDQLSTDELELALSIQKLLRN